MLMEVTMRTDHGDDAGVDIEHRNNAYYLE